MKQTWADQQRDRKTIQDVEAQAAEMPKCWSCKAETDNRTLFSFGGLCNACFQHYCMAGTQEKRRNQQ